MSVGRSTDRQDFTDIVRIRLLEQDLDDYDKRFDKVDTRFDSVDDRLGKILGVGVSLLVAVCTACILLLVNIGISR